MICQEGISVKAKDGGERVRPGGPSSSHSFTSRIFLNFTERKTTQFVAPPLSSDWRNPKGRGVGEGWSVKTRFVGGPTVAHPLSAPRLSPLLSEVPDLGEEGRFHSKHPVGFNTVLPVPLRFFVIEDPLLSFYEFV